MPKKHISFAIIAVFVVAAGFFLWPTSKLHLWVLHLLNQDTIYLTNGTILNGWIWDEKGNVVIGETNQDEIFVFKKDELDNVKNDVLLYQLHRLM